MERSLTLASLVFIDAAVSNHYVAQGSSKAESLVLRADQDGIDQITAALTACQSIRSLHIIALGSPSSLQLGSTYLTLFNLDRYGWQLQQWGEALAANAKIVLQSCQLPAANTPPVSRSLLTRLHLLTGANIVASNLCLDHRLDRCLDQSSEPQLQKATTEETIQVG